MSIALRFKDRGYDVITNSWTAASRRGDTVTVCYTWGADGISLFSSAVSSSRVVLNISFGEFHRLVTNCKSSDLLDLTRYA